MGAAWTRIAAAPDPGPWVAPAEAAWAYADFGPAGRVVSREVISAPDFVRLTFENGLVLNFKQAPFASNQVTVTVRDLARLGQAVDATVTAGANTVGGVTFGLQNPQVAEDAARLDAVKALQAKADLYARATGYKIVRLINLGEGGGYTPAPPMPVFAMAKREMADSTPVASGELKVRIDVSATYEVAR
ncbi:MAG: SIMPL domain-containing protein [Alphaproteobacteria bacterium]|nr:SIMPL domain-containing protein [Alphaproteobacteria bacterium]